MRIMSDALLNRFAQNLHQARGSGVHKPLRSPIGSRVRPTVTSCWSALAIVILSCGCQAPIGSKRKPTSPSGHQRRMQQEHTQSANASSSNGRSNLRLTVNSDSCTAETMWREIADEVAEQRAALPPAEFQAFLNRRAVQLITDKVAELLLYQTASVRLEPDLKKNIEQFADQEIRRLVTEKHGGVQGNYERYLAERGETLNEVRERVRREMTISGYLETEVKPRVVEPTRKELTDHFNANKDSWRKGARRSMSLIEVRMLDRLPKDVANPSRAQQEAARAEALSLIRAAQLELRNGASFADTARRYSDGGRAAEGGAWGWVNPESVRERYLPAIEALASLGHGQISEIVETADGYFLVRCDELEGGFEPTFEGIQPELRQQYFRAAYSREIGKVVDQLRNKARIEPTDLEQFHAALVAAALR
jgi:peptidyl-prolyl cis-trans isomerase SurA